MFRSETGIFWYGDIAQLIKCLLYKLENLSRIPKTHLTMPDATVCTISPLGRGRQADSWGSLDNQTNPIGRLQINERPYLKKQGGLLASMRKHTNVREHISTRTNCTYTPPNKKETVRKLCSLWSPVFAGSHSVMSNSR